MSNILEQNFESDIDYLVVGDAKGALGQLDVDDQLTQVRKITTVRRLTDKFGEYDLLQVHTVNTKPLPAGKIDVFADDLDHAGLDYSTITVRAYINPVPPVVEEP